MTNQKKLQKIVEAIQKLVAAEVQSQMVLIKADITRQVLSELKRSGGAAINSNNSKGQNKKYSSNPLLNEVLAETRMNAGLLDGQHQQVMDEFNRPLNITTQGSDGKQVNLQNPAVQSVLEAMNKRYDEFISTPPPPSTKSIPTPTTSKYVQSMMDITDDDINNGLISFPDPFAEEGR